jgi:4-amino-4-deoxy-L-arabinose transferase-like glycosyltransferase
MTAHTRTEVLARPLRAIPWRLLFVMTFVALVPIVLMAPLYSEPFERDEGVYATLAQAIIRGELPYRDAWDNKPPLVAVWYALSFLTLGEAIEAPRVAASIFGAGSVLVVFLLVRRMYGERPALAAGLILGLAFGIPYLQANANTEIFLVLPMVGALYACWRGVEEDSRSWLVVAGMLSALAFLTKQPAMWNLFALAAFIAWTARKQGRAAITSGLGALGAGVLAGLAPFVLFFAATRLLDDVYFANFTYNELWAREIPLAKRLLRMITLPSLNLALASAFLTVGAAVSGVRIVGSRARPADVLILLWVVGSFLGVKTSGKDYPHYYVQLLPGLSILCALLVYELAPWRRSAPWRGAASLGLLALFLLSVAWNARVYALGSLNDVHEEKFPNQSVTEADFQAQDVANYIALVTEPNDTIFNLGRESQLYFLADREPATEFIYDRSFWLAEDTFDEAMRDLRAARPKLIIDSLNSELVGSVADDVPSEFTAFLRANYEYAGRLHYAQIYLLEDREVDFSASLLRQSLPGVY